VMTCDEHERIPPVAIEAEQATLGCMLYDKDACLEGLAILSEDDFFREAHRIIWRTIKDLRAKPAAIDPVTVTAELNRKGQLEEAGGAPYLAVLMDKGTALHLEHYAEIVAEKSRLRRLIQLATEIADKAHGQEDAATLMAMIQAGADGIGISREDRKSPVMLDVAMRTMDIIAARAETRQLFGYRTGLYKLDNILGGLQKQDLIVIAGRPSMGKSAFIQPIVAGVTKNHPDAGGVLWVSLEMSAESVATRWLLSEARIPSENYRLGKMAEHDVERVREAFNRISRLPVEISDNPYTTISQIRAHARRMKNRGELALLVVDYLQLLRIESAKENRHLDLGEATRNLKQIARELDVPVIIISQLNRSVEKRESKRPAIADLRESGTIEEHADIILLLFCEDYYDSKKRPGELDVIIAKHRNGPTGTVTLKFDRRLTEITNLSW